MKKNYYEILEIDRHASKEVIEKAYKALVKKYHPDLQPEDKKQLAEIKIKQINDAYSVLSDKSKKSIYDSTLPNTSISEEQYYNLLNEKENLKKQLNNLKLNNTQKKSVSRPHTSYSSDNINRNSTSQNTNKTNQNYDVDASRKIEEAVNKAYHDAYIKSLKDRGYNIVYKKTFMEKVQYLIALLLTGLFVVIVVFLIWKIPYTHDKILSLIQF